MRSANEASKATEGLRHNCQTVTYTQYRKTILTYRELRTSSLTHDNAVVFRLRVTCANSAMKKAEAGKTNTKK